MLRLRFHLTPVRRREKESGREGGKKGGGNGYHQENK
jgi:hypothetical protein